MPIYFRNNNRFEVEFRNLFLNSFGKINIAALLWFYSYSDKTPVSRQQ